MLRCSISRCSRQISCLNRHCDGQTVDRGRESAQDGACQGRDRPPLSQIETEGQDQMTTKVMQGVRILEVAQFTFTPAAGAILADWGADVIKVEHPVRGDTQRGFLNMGGVKLDPLRHTLIEHPNRGKRSVGIDLSTPEGQEVLYELAKTADVFLTNYLPQHRQKNKFDVEHIRAVNPNIIYARGSALGNKGPERHVGGFDGTCFWNRSGIAHAMTPAELDGPLSQGMPAF